MFHQLMNQAEAGDQVGLLLRGIKRDEIRRGQVVAEPKSQSLQNHIQAQASIRCVVRVSFSFPSGSFCFLFWQPV